MRIFIDTWGFITLFNKKEFLHKVVKNLYNKKVDRKIFLLHNRLYNRRKYNTDLQ